MAADVLRTHVILPKELVEQIDRRVGPRRRSEFLARAAQRELDLEGRLQAFDEFAGSLQDVHVPGWETSESAAEWVRAQRRIGSDGWEEAAGSDLAP
jgi:metal-responsive CopG/Arc/MetJ family transcriptional regulator